MSNKKISELNNRIEFLQGLKEDAQLPHTQKDDVLTYIRTHPFFYIGLALVIGIILGWWWGEVRTADVIYSRASECLDNEKMNQSTMVECTYNALIQ